MSPEIILPLYFKLLSLLLEMGIAALILTAIMALVVLFMTEWS